MPKFGRIRGAPKCGRLRFLDYFTFYVEEHFHFLFMAEGKHLFWYFLHIILWVFTESIAYFFKANKSHFRLLLRDEQDRQMEGFYFLKTATAIALFFFFNLL